VPPSDLEGRRERSLGHVRNAIRIVRRVISENRELGAAHPRHRPSAERRIREGEAELETLKSEEEKLGDS
jgi:inhibitor of KinA sporulation pathway (predicted exonuclease)